MPHTTTRRMAIALGTCGVLAATAGAFATTERAIELAVIVFLALAGGVIAVAAYRASARGRRGRKAAEEALRAAEERFHAIFDQAFQFTLLLTPGGEVVEANETARAFYDGAHDTLLGRRLWEETAKLAGLRS